MEKDKNGRIASWIALIGGVFSLVCVAVLALSLIDPPSEFSIWGAAQVLLVAIDIQLVPPLTLAAMVFGILGLIRSRQTPGRIRTRAWIGTISAGLVVLTMIVMLIWIRWYA